MTHNIQFNWQHLHFSSKYSLLLFFFFFFKIIIFSFFIFFFIGCGHLHLKQEEWLCCCLQYWTIVYLTPAIFKIQNIQNKEEKKLLLSLPRKPTNQPSNQINNQPFKQQQTSKETNKKTTYSNFPWCS